MKYVTGTLLPPNMCLICEESPQDMGYVDTFREIDPDHFTNLSGRKYVCTACIDQMAHLCGYEHSSLAREAEDFLIRYRQKVVETAQQFGALSSKVLETYGELPASALDHSPPTTEEVVASAPKEKASAK